MLRIHAWLVALATVSAAQAQDIIRGEYFIDQDLGWGENIPFQLSADNDTAGVQLPVSLDGYEPGVHTIGIRTLDDSARWSLTNFTAAVVVEPPPPIEDLVEVEYFLNEDPGFGEGQTGWSGNTTDLPLEQFAPDLSDAVVGVNTLFTRTRTANGVWSLTNHQGIVVIEPPPALPEIVRVEAFNINEGPDPGFGSATPFTIAEPIIDFTGILASDEPFSVSPMDTIAFRSRDSYGRWSLTNFMDSVDVVNTGSPEALLNTTGIAVFPNPFTDAFTVQPADAQPLRVILYDPHGKLVHDEVLNTTKRIDLSSLSNGAYTAFFWKDLARIHRVTLIKQ